MMSADNKSAAKPMVELSNYTLAPMGSGTGINNFHFALQRGDVCAIESQNPDDGHLLLRALAMLVRPVQGVYRYKGRRRDLSLYRESLPCKREIAYIAHDATLISNMTIRQNLLLMRYYFENNLNIEPDEEVLSLCRTFGIDDKLHKRPAELNAMELQGAVVIREMIKKPEMLLLHRPEDFIGHAQIDVLAGFFNDWISAQHPVVFLSNDRRLVRRFATRKVVLSSGTLTASEM